MKIVYLDFDDIKNPLLAAGQATATLGAAKELVKRGHQVTVICSKYPGYKDRIQDGIHYQHIGIGSKNILLNNAWYFLAIPFAVSKLNRKNTDIIIECFTAPISTLFTPLFTKVPVVVLPSMFNAKAFAKKYHLPFHWVEGFGIRFYKYFMPYSTTDQAKILSMNPTASTKIVSQGVDPSYFKINHLTSKHILFLGRFDIAQKGIDLLIEAYSQARESIPLPLVLAGHGPDEEKIHNLIKKNNLEDQISIVGSAYGEKKKQLIQHSHFVVFPSRHDELSLWALEAIAAGQPILGFDLPECSWAPDIFYSKVTPYDVNAYAKQLVKLANRQDLDEMRKEARSFAKQFTWENVAESFLSFFKYILEQERKS